MNPFPLAVLLASLVWVQAQDPPKTWRVSERPILSIGSSDAEGPELFGSVEGAVRLSSGTVVVADGKSLELRFFSPEIGRDTSELQSLAYLVCRLLLEKKNITR